MIAIKTLLMPCLALAATSAVAVGGYYGYEYFSSTDKSQTQDQNLQGDQSPVSTENPNSQQGEARAGASGERGSAQNSHNQPGTPSASVAGGATGSTPSNAAAGTPQV